ncbi:MAG: MFS transporter [Bacteroidota bacterium]
MNAPLSTARQIGYACGMLGFSTLMNIISVMLIYVYVPPSNSGLVPLIPQLVIWGVFSLLSLVVASGRLFDAISDPLVAYWSDRSQHSRGRRTPFMAWALLPAALFCLLIFIPYHYGQSSVNLWWLAAMQLGFYFFLTLYIIPFNALLPELATSPEEKIRLSSWLSFGYVIGIIVSSQTPLLADTYQSLFALSSRNEAIQWAIGSLALFAALVMILPIISIDEKEHCHSQPITIPLRTAIRQTLSNRNFLLFVLAETFYFVSITLVVSGLLYYLSVLLKLEESLGGFVMGTMVLVSLFFYPFVGKLTQRFGAKRIILFSFAWLGTLLGGIYFMGKMPIPPEAQIFGFAILASLPLAFLGILPYAIIAELAQADSQQTGQQKEALYFAVRNLANKFGQTFGIMIFAILTLFGKDPDDDLGIRLSGALGCLLCFAAVLAFSRYKEK